jgi:hypothetical protein
METAVPTTHEDLLARACGLAAVEIPRRAVSFEEFCERAARHLSLPPAGEPGAEHRLLTALRPCGPEDAGAEGMPASCPYPRADPETAERLVSALYAAAWNYPEDPESHPYAPAIYAGSTTGGQWVVGLIQRETEEGTLRVSAFEHDVCIGSFARDGREELLALWATLSARVGSPLPDGVVSATRLRALRNLSGALDHATDFFARAGVPAKTPEIVSLLGEARERLEAATTEIEDRWEIADD